MYLGAVGRISIMNPRAAWWGLIMSCCVAYLGMVSSLSLVSVMYVPTPLQLQELELQDLMWGDNAQNWERLHVTVTLESKKLAKSGCEYGVSLLPVDSDGFPLEIETGQLRELGCATQICAFVDGVKVCDVNENPESEFEVDTVMGKCHMSIPTALAYSRINSKRFVGLNATWLHSDAGNYTCEITHLDDMTLTVTMEPFTAMYDCEDNFFWSHQNEECKPCQNEDILSLCPPGHFVQGCDALAHVGESYCSPCENTPTNFDAGFYAWHPTSECVLECVNNQQYQYFMNGTVCSPCTQSLRTCSEDPGNNCCAKTAGKMWQACTSSQNEQCVDCPEILKLQYSQNEVHIPWTSDCESYFIQSFYTLPKEPPYCECQTTCIDNHYRSLTIPNVPCVPCSTGQELLLTAEASAEAGETYKFQQCTKASNTQILQCEQKELGCDGIAYSGKVFDLCDICGGDNTTCIGCDGVLNSEKEYDECGICDGDSTTCQGCDGVPNSGLVVDVCGQCGGDNTSCWGCDNVSNSGLVFDACGECGGDGSSCWGCDNVSNSKLVFDACHVCGGDNATCTGCDGVLNSGLVVDVCNQCGGDNTSCWGCDNVSNSGSVFDFCGVCAGDNSTCVGCDGVIYQPPVGTVGLLTIPPGINAGTRTWRIGQNGGFTILMKIRINVNPNAYRRLFHITSSNTDVQVQTHLSNSDLDLQMDTCQNNNNTWTTGTQVLDFVYGSWNTVIAQYQHSSRQLSMTINGQTRYTTCSMDNFLDLVNAETWVGSMTDGVDPMTGQIAAFQGFDRYLSDSEVAAVAASMALPSAWAGDECPTVDPVYAWEPVALTGTATVRCCATSGGDCTVMAPDETCMPEDITYADAVLKCESYGMRLCTKDELQSGNCCGKHEPGRGAGLDWFGPECTTAPGLVWSGELVEFTPVMPTFVPRKADDCGVCGGANETKDSCGVCYGDNSTCTGCDGVVNSGKKFDKCNVCDGDNTTCECDIGYTGPQYGKLSDSCVPCGPGTYKDVIGSAACTECGFDTYNPEYGSTSSSACLPCMEHSETEEIYGHESINACMCVSGYYHDTPTSCTACTPGTFNAEKNQTQCSNCNAGSYSGSSGSTTCQLCASNTYSHEGSALCTNCTGNTESPAGSTLVTNCICKEGYTGPDGGHCQACLAGTYKSGTGSSACISCGSGTYSTSSAATTCSTCQSCSSGQYLSSCGGSSAGTCVDCATRAASVCQANTYLLNCGASYSGACSPCASCLAGEQRNGCTGVSAGSCGACPSGTFKPSAGTEPCQTCPTCSAGKYHVGTCDAVNGNSCIDCAAGKYSSAAGLTVCQSCVSGTFSTTASSVCTTCTAGKYSSNAGTTQCTDCAAGKYSTTSGADTSATCQNCAAGKYSNTIGADTSATCQNCATGTYSNTIGADTSVTCQDCVAGKYSAAAGASVCTNCAAGKYSSTSGASTSATCQNCATGMYSNTIGADTSVTCQYCVAGKYSAVAGASVCTNCPAGKYSSTSGGSTSGSCQDCVAGKYSAAGVQLCTNCAAGKYSAATGASVCTDCAAGKYSSTVGASTSATCQDCAAGKYSSTGLSVCTDCAAGKYSAATGASVCTNCASGKYSFTSGASTSSTCQNCAAGKYSAAAASVCTNCASGKYSAAGAQQCTDCAVGKYSSTVGASTSATCQDCAAGKYSAAGAQQCTDCAAGKYSAATGTSVCTDCAAGKYSTASGQTSESVCLTCAAGRISASGSSGCSVCRSGRYTEGSDRTNCLSCASTLGGGWTTLSAGSDSQDDCCLESSYSNPGFATCVDSSTAHNTCDRCCSGKSSYIDATNSQKYCSW